MTRSTPAGWTVRPLADLVEILDSKRVPVNAKERVTRVGGVPYYGATGQVGMIDSALFDEDLVLLGEDGVQFFDPFKPKAYRISGPSWVNNHAHVLRAGDSLDWRYLEHYLNAFDYSGFANGTTRLKLTQSAMRQMPIAFPSIVKQRRIVETLNGHLSRLDAAAESLGEARMRTVLLHETWVLQILGVHGYSSRVVEGRLPDLPEGWRWGALGDLAEVVGGVTKDVNKESTPGFVEVPYLRVANVQRGYLDLSGVTTIRVAPDKASALALQPGDVLMNEGGDRDKLARGWIWENQIEGCIHQNHVFRARPGANVRSEWLAWCANSYGSRWAQRHGRQSVNLASISVRTIKTMPVPVPPLEIQDERIGHVREALESAARLRAQIGVGLERAAALRKSLLKAAFSGRLTATTNTSWASEGFEAEKEELAG